MSFWKIEKIKKTRKPHRCELCGRKIPAGSEAEYNCGMWEGDFQSYYFCTRCVRFLEEYKKEIDLSDGFSSDDFYDTVYQSKEATCPECGSANHREYEWSEDRMTCQFECDNCDCKWTGDFTFSAAELAQV